MMRRRRAWAAGVVGISTLLTLGAVAGDAPARAAGRRGPDTVGQWTLPFEEDGAAAPAKPTAVETAVLGDGRVLYFNGRDSGARVLDLRAGAPRWTVPQAEGDLFGTDITALPNGKLLLAGGSQSKTSLFDPGTDRFQAAGPMKFPRSFPHVAIGPDGTATVFGGSPRRTETYRPDSNRWEENYAGPASETTLPLQPRIVLAPNGKFFYAAVGQLSDPSGHAADEALTAFFQFFDPRTKTWSVSGLAPYGARNGAFVVPLTLEPPYDKITLVTGGGGLGPTPGLPANPITALATIDTNGNVTNRNGSDLNRARWHSSGVLLADGQLLAVGGTDRDDTLSPGLGFPVLVPELYNPIANQWTVMAPHERARGYHSSALLLPDMRVLLGGNDNDPSFEIWSPPYLFRGPRPTVVRVQSGVSYGETFNITTPDAGLIESVLLLRTPSPGHANDSDQRALKLEFTRSGANTLTATAPPQGNVAPPGPYYLVVNKKSLQGPIPSVARMVAVGRTDLSDAPRPFPDDAPAPTGGSATHPSQPAPLAPLERRWLTVGR